MARNVFFLVSQTDQKNDNQYGNEDNADGEAGVVLFLVMVVSIHCCLPAIQIFLPPFHSFLQKHLELPLHH